MERILVTGGAGFIGSNFIRLVLSERDAEVRNLDAMTYAGNPASLADVEKNPRYSFVKCDINDTKNVSKALEGIDSVVHFAAESHVDNSIKDASAFVRTNVQGTKNMVECAVKAGVERFVQVSCYDEKTRALTTEGLKSFDEIKEGDVVFSLNPQTNEMELKPVEKVIIQDYEGEMYHFHNKRINLKVTPNHRMFIGNTNKQIVVESAEEAAKRSVLYMPEPFWEGKDVEFYNLDGVGVVKTEDLFYLMGIFIGDGFSAYQEKSVKTRTGLNREDFLAKARDEKGKFMALVNASGYETICHAYRIFLDIPENDKCRRRVETTLSNLGISYSKHNGKAGTHLYFTSKEWMDFFDQCGKGAANKQIPRWALEYAPKYLMCLFEGLMDSDGRKRRSYSTVSEKLMSGFSELCIKLGFKARVRRKHSLSFLDGRRIEGNSYDVVVSKTNKSIVRHRINRVQYKGNIWCLKVKDNKNFLVEREGKFDFCGNTDEVYGSIEKGSSRETDRLEPRNPYSATKAASDLIALSYYATFGLDVVVTRSSNNYGPYQYPEKVIPLFITNLIEGKKVPLYGDGKNVRDWLYVEDNCRGILAALQKGKPGNIYNIGGGNEVRNIDLTRKILRLMGKGDEMVQHVEDRKGHDRRYSLDSTKAREELGWNPGKKFDDGLEETVEWYSKNDKWWKPLKVKGR